MYNTPYNIKSSPCLGALVAVAKDEFMPELDFAKKYSRELEYLKNSVRSIPDYPKEGILFRDITTLCIDPKAFPLSVRLLAERCRGKKIDKIAAAEARGFIFGAALAVQLGCGFVMVRKPGKLPAFTIEESYELEYGVNKLQLHEDSIKQGESVLVVDDLLATGGTVEAILRLVTRLGGTPAGAAFVIELFDEGGAERLKRNYKIDVFSLLKFPGH